jgi:hypothetical protein
MPRPRAVQPAATDLDCELGSVHPGIIVSRRGTDTPDATTSLLGRSVCLLRANAGLPRRRAPKTSDAPRRTSIATPCSQARESEFDRREGLDRLYYNFGCAQQEPRRRRCWPARHLLWLGRRPRPWGGRPGGKPAGERKTGGTRRSRAGPAGRVRGTGRQRDRSALPRPRWTRAPRSGPCSQWHCLRAGLRRARDGAGGGGASRRTRVGPVRPDRRLRDRPLAAQRRAARGAGCRARRAVGRRRAG